MIGPLALVLTVAHLVQTSSCTEQQGKGMLDSRFIMLIGAGRHDDVGGEIRCKHVVRTSKYRLNPAEIAHSFSSVREVAVVPVYEYFCVNEIFEYWFVSVVLVERNAEALKQVWVED